MKKFLNVLKVFAIALLVVPVAFVIAACGGKKCDQCGHKNCIGGPDCQCDCTKDGGTCECDS